MAEVPDDEEDTEYDEFSINSRSDDGGYEYDNYALTGMRMLFQRIEGEEVDEEDEIEENEDDDEEEPARPSPAFILQKLVEQGVTMEDLVKSLLTAVHEEYIDVEEFNRTEGEVFGKMRIIISNYVEPEP
jgi:hypothetical protein